MKHFIITGTGRCGTAWCAAVLRLCNIPCGHQDVFRHEHFLEESDIDFKGLVGSSSFEAMPLVARLDLPNQLVDVVHIVRKPLDVVRSWVELGNFGNDMEKRFKKFYKVVKIVTPTVFEWDTPHERALQYWISWNLLCGFKCNYHLQIESITIEKLLAALNLSPHLNEMAFSLPKINQRTESKEKYEFTVKDFDPELLGFATMVAKKFGYKEDEVFNEG